MINPLIALINLSTYEYLVDYVSLLIKGQREEAGS